MFKIGYDKFVQVFEQGENVKHHVREIKHGPRGYWNFMTKFIVLSTWQFNRLAGLIMSGKSNLDKAARLTASISNWVVFIERI